MQNILFVSQCYNAVSICDTCWDKYRWQRGSSVFA